MPTSNEDDDNPNDVATALERGPGPAGEAEPPRLATIQEWPEARALTILCAWCGKLLQGGGELQSHGICDECLPIVLDQVEARLGGEPALGQTNEPRPGD